MSWIVPWNGKEFDIDPGEFTGRELSEIKKRTGLAYRALMTEALPELDPDAIRVLFWIVERRTQPDLVFGDYDGPPIRVVLAHFDGFTAAMDEMGKALEKALPPTSGSSGSDGSPSSTDALIGMSGLG